MSEVNKTVNTDFLEDKIVTVKYITKETNGIMDPNLLQLLKTRR